MTPSEARDYIEDVFGDAWTTFGYDPTRIKWRDVPNEIPAGEVPWARVTLRHSTGNRASLSSGPNQRRFRYTGVMIAQLFTPIGDGSVAGYSIAEAILTAYQTAQHDNVWFKNVRFNEIDSEGSGPFSQINVIADFSYDSVK